MKKTLFIALIVSLALLSCETVRETTGKLVEKGGDLLNRKAVLVRNDPAKIADTEKYRDLPVSDRAKNVPPAIASSIQKNPVGLIGPLVEHLVKGVEDDFLKVKNLHDWIALNISYDTVSFFNGTIPDQSYVEVMKRKASVCEGYSSVFREMCGRAEIDCVTIHGYARGFGYDLFSEEKLMSNHAWNAVNIHGTWYLVDTTWDAGHVSGKAFQRSYSTAYLLSPAKRFLYTHYPEAAMWQLLEEPVKREDYAKLPFLQGEYFQSVERAEFEIKGKIIRAGAMASFGFKAKDGSLLSGTLLDRNAKEYKGRVFVEQCSGYDSMIYISFPSAGKYALRLFSRAPNAKSGSSIADIGFMSDSGSGIVYPLAYQYFGENRCSILSPVSKYLKEAEPAEVKLVLPGIQKAFLAQGKTRTEMRKLENNIFVAALPKVDGDFVDVFGSVSANSTSYIGIVRLYIVNEPSVPNQRK